MQPVAIDHLPLTIVLLANLDDQLVRFPVLKPNEIELVRPGLAGVPDLVKIRLDTHAPTQNQGVKVQFVHSLFNEYGPFKQVCLDIKPDLTP